MEKAAGGAAGPNAPLTTPQPAENYGYKVAQNYSQQVRVLNGRAFYQNGDVWSDSTIQSKQNAKRIEIKFNSDEYFALLKKYPHLAQWMALGSNVDVMVEENVYCVR